MENPKAAERRLELETRAEVSTLKAMMRQLNKKLDAQPDDAESERHLGELRKRIRAIAERMER